MAPFFEIFTGSLLGCLFGYFIMNIGDKGIEEWFIWDSGDKEKDREFREYSDMLEYLELHGWRTLHCNKRTYESFTDIENTGSSPSIPTLTYNITIEHFCRQTISSRFVARMFRIWKYAAEWLRNEKN